MRVLSALLLMSVCVEAQETGQARVDAVKRSPGLVAFWDFVLREGEQFAAHRGKQEKADLRLDPVNYVRQYWAEGREATMADFPVAGEGPFGAAVEFRAETDANFRPVLLVPRERLHGSGIDVKGPGQSVTLLAWVKRTGGNHAIAGIWHEGTDLKENSKAAARVERGMRQYALFAGLAANQGASAAHVSENGASSFGDKYARNLSVTPERLPEDWCLVGMRFDNRKNTVTSSLDGVETEYWIENPSEHPFFKWAAKGWAEGSYRPPKQFVRVKDGKLVGLKVNPFWFPHDLHTPEQGGPFTIGRVIHSSRGVGFTGSIGGVAVWNRAISRKELRRVAQIGRGPDGRYRLVKRP